MSVGAGGIGRWRHREREQGLTALLDELRSWLTPTLEVLGGGGDPSTSTMLAIQTLMATCAEHRAAAPTYVQAVANAPLLASLQEGLVALWAELRALLASDMTTMARRGELPPWVEPVPMVALLAAVANGLVLHITVDPDGPGLPEMAAQFGALLLTARTPA